MGISWNVLTARVRCVSLAFTFAAKQTPLYGHKMASSAVAPKPNIFHFETPVVSKTQQHPKSDVHVSTRRSGRKTECVRKKPSLKNVFQNAKLVFMEIQKRNHHWQTKNRSLAPGDSIKLQRRRKHSDPRAPCGSQSDFFRA